MKYIIKECENMKYVNMNSYKDYLAYKTEELQDISVSDLRENLKHGYDFTLTIKDEPFYDDFEVYFGISSMTQVHYPEKFDNRIKTYTSIDTWEVEDGNQYLIRTRNGECFAIELDYTLSDRIKFLHSKGCAKSVAIDLAKDWLQEDLQRIEDSLNGYIWFVYYILTITYYGEEVLFDSCSGFMSDDRKYMMEIIKDTLEYAQNKEIYS